jgi:UDP-N-acetylglucosamine 4,6-dehydratase
MNSILSLLGRDNELFANDLEKYESQLLAEVGANSFLVIGGAGSIGQAVCKEIFKRKPIKLHVVDISENNLVELVRDIRSSFGYISGDFQTFALDVGSLEYDAFIKSDGKYDYVLNLSALKHVRSEKDPFTLMRMIDVNIFHTEKSLKQAIEMGAKKYFCVSTDKATNPVNMMGASKRIMEMFLTRQTANIAVSTARFANVAFSNGSLLDGFNQRIQKRQPLVAPNDIKRYFLTPQESGELCLMSCILGDNRDIFFPKISESLGLFTFSDIAVKYLQKLGYEPQICQTEDEARALASVLPSQGKWPCIFSKSDTTGEKDIEEFYTTTEVLDMERFHSLGIIKTLGQFDAQKINYFKNEIQRIKHQGTWTKAEIVQLFFYMIPDFGHKDVGKYLDSKM